MQELEQADEQAMNIYRAQSSILNKALGIKPELID